MSGNALSRDGNYSRVDVERQREAGEANFDFVFAALKEVACGRMDQLGAHAWIAQHYPERLGELGSLEPFPPGWGASS